ncbi:thermonuclease family protein [Candidatus Magnetomonas plexicatena]|uniref:thermonuclease family protein n=1 Tax=Candidatus Magnetomonas plexicatena TaxID=2552947 RepID=UPI001100EF10|nr:thermonuclease family protein [Nitrospirales bacterium LBB_01]QWR76936.1 thermonuclease family protein [Nitrospirales bacterium LBB_01]
MAKKKGKGNFLRRVVYLLIIAVLIYVTIFGFYPRYKKQIPTLVRKIPYLEKIYKPAGTPIKARVVRVYDGDTVVVAPLEGNKRFICRLYGIDAPEVSNMSQKGQPYAVESLQELKKLVSGYTVEVTTTGDSSYNREICLITRDGLDINLEMVKRGYAWAYVKYLKKEDSGRYVDAKIAASEKKLGLWRQKAPEPPWEFRKRHEFK